MKEQCFFNLKIVSSILMRLIKVKKISYIFIVLISSYGLCTAQTVRHKNQYGDAYVYADGETLRTKNQYGDALYYFDGKTIRQKNQYKGSPY